jgi:hypothetical protein
MELLSGLVETRFSLDIELLRFLLHRKNMMTRAATSAATAPITIPAIAPPERCDPLACCGVNVVEEEEVEVDCDADEDATVAVAPAGRLAADISADAVAFVSTVLLPLIAGLHCCG